MAREAAKTRTGLLLLLLRCAVALGLLYLISRQLDKEELVGLLSSSNLWWLIPAVLMQLLSSLVAALRWRRLMQLLGFGGTTGFYLVSYLKAVLFNQGLPSSIGGDAMRVLDVVSMGNRKRESFAAVITDRVFGISGLLLLALVANNATAHPFSPGFVFAVNLVCGSLLAAIPCIAIAGLLPWIGNLPLRRIAFLEPMWIVSDYVRKVFLVPRHLLAQLLLALLTHACVVLAFMAIGEALSIQVSIDVYLVFVPPLMLFTFLPLSLAGWGIRESGAVAMLALVGVPQAESFAMSIIYGLVLICTAGPGLLLYLGKAGYVRGS